MKKWKGIISTLAILMICVSFSVKEVKARTLDIQIKEVEMNALSQTLSLQASSSAINLDDFRLYKTLADVRPDKTWTINFNKPVNEKTIHDLSVGVIDETTGERINVQMIFGGDRKSVKVSLANGKRYSYGHTYNLYLTDGIKSKSDKSLKPVKLRFTIIKDTSQKDTMYNIIRDALLSAYSRVNVSDAVDYNRSELKSVIERVYRENPLILYLRSCTMDIYGNLEFKYDKDAETSLAHAEAVKVKAREIISRIIKPGMDDFQKEKVVHDYIINHAVYDSRAVKLGNIPAEDYSAYGVLINGVGVCESYAEAMEYIMQQLGIDCRIVEGTGSNGEGDWIPHEWNVIKINGNWYQLDLTWDDSSASNPDYILKYQYFNVTDAEMRVDHKYTKDYPSCTATKDNYYYKKGAVVKDYNTFYNKIAGAIQERDRKLEIKVLNYSSSTYDIRAAINKAAKEYCHGVDVKCNARLDGNIMIIIFAYGSN